MVAEMTITHILYRFFDDQKNLLYIGITSDPATRFKQHSSHKTRWHTVATITLEHYPTRSDVEAAELHAIATEHPLHNIRGNPTHKPTNDTDLPDDCDICNENDITSIYLPYRWTRTGTAYYACTYAHDWQVKWPKGAVLNPGSRPKNVSRRLSPGRDELTPREERRIREVLADPTHYGRVL